MASGVTRAGAARGGGGERGGKRASMLAGALAVFARDGYARAGIDTIAAEAGVSTRTLYNHFGDKAGIFREVIRDSASRVAEAQLDTIDRCLRRIRTVADLEEGLNDCGLGLIAPVPEHEVHGALVRQIRAEAAHIPADAMEEWQESGPGRVQAELARRFGAFAEGGLLRAGDLDRAAEHFSALVAAGRPGTEEERLEAVASGVRAFLYGHGAARRGA